MRDVNKNTGPDPGSAVEIDDETRDIKAELIAAAALAAESNDNAADDGAPSGTYNDNIIDTTDKTDPDAMPAKFTEVMPLVENRKWIELRLAISSWPPPEVADFAKRLEPSQRLQIIRFLPGRFSAEVFSELDPASQAGILAELTNTEVRKLLADLEPDDRTTLFDEMDVPLTRRLLNLLSPQDLKLTRELLSYPEGSVGRMMTPSLVCIKENWTVRKAVDHIRKFGHDSETINVVYITNSKGTLIDDLTLSNIIMANPDEEISALMDYSFIAIKATDSQEEAVEMIKKYNYFALPVTDSSGVLLGIVTVDDLMDIADTQATEDFQKIGAISVESEDGPIENLKDAPVLLLYKRRIPWLVALVFVGIFSGAAVSFFEETIAAKTMLVFFLTLLLAGGGNSGSQSATLMIRALATGDVKMKDWSKMIMKELLVAGSLGAVMAVTAALLGVFRDGWLLAAIVAISMFLIVMAGSLLGMCLPFLLRKFGKDPAAASAPLVATISDTVGVLIYFSVAAVMLR